MNTPASHSSTSRLLVWLCVVGLGWMMAMRWAGAATVVSGYVSGTWTTNGSPYILSAQCTVLSNATLTIQPGVTVIIGPDMALEGIGRISAIGTPEQPIVLRGASPTSNWSIGLYNRSFTYPFHYCRISDCAGTAFNLNVDGGGSQLTAEFLNCDFSNCRDGAIVGSALSYSPGQSPTGGATLAVEIHNCVFDATGNACLLNTYYTGPNPADVQMITAHITGNVFKNLSGAALRTYLQDAGQPKTNFSRPYFINNTVVKASRGVELAYSGFDAVIENNLFMRTTNALVGTSSSSVAASYNCFSSNTANFVGYSGIYGVPVQNNHNGDPCDAFFNIFLNPQVLDTNQFLLSNSSPCIDAGDPAIADVCPQLSHGSAISDIGAYGGPDACGWLTHGFAPVITGPPAHQSSCVGSGAAFQVSVQGSAPLNYRWYFNTNTLLTGETNAQLSLVNLQTNLAGLYSVAVSNAFGSVTSTPARLLVFDACVGINLYAGLSITGIVGRTYVVDASTNIVGPNWVPFATNTFTQPGWLLIDTNTPFHAGRFFRVRLLP